MSVYVDNMRASFNRMVMYHMIADSTDELLEMAEKIGLSARWLQKPGTSHEHFDVCASKRALAVAHGAREIGPLELGRMLLSRTPYGRRLLSLTREPRK